MLTEEMRHAFGYDEMGNCDLLLAPADRVAIAAGIQRAAGSVICRCGVEYYRHPPVQGALWLTRTCEGLYKL